MLAPTELQLEPDDVLDKVALTAIATAFHWQSELDSGKYMSQRQLARAKGLHYAVVWRQLKLIHLDPYIIKKLLNGRQPSGFSIYEMMDALPLKWEEQRKRFGF